MSEKQQHWRELIERETPAPLVRGIVDDFPPATQAAISQAISLKRIADALTTTDKYGLHGSASLAQAIVDGLKS